MDFYQWDVAIKDRIITNYIIPRFKFKINIKHLFTIQRNNLSDRKLSHLRVNVNKTIGDECYNSFVTSWNLSDKNDIGGISLDVFTDRSFGLTNYYSSKEYRLIVKQPSI